MDYTPVGEYLILSIDAEGRTIDIKKRIKKHNESGSPYTSQYKLWRITTAVAFSDRQKSFSFEKYLKSHSSRAFSRKHF